MPYLRSEIDRMKLDLCASIIVGKEITGFDISVSPFKKKIKLNGEINYLLFKFAKEYCEKYEDFQRLFGEIECAKHEIYRRLVAPYEDKKIEENGDVK